MGSRTFFEQMIGRGTRVISANDLQAVTPDAAAKTHFVIVDAVGVVEHPKADTQTLERKRSVPFDNARLRHLLTEIQKRSEQTLDMVSADRVIEAGFSAQDTESVQSTVESFRRFIEQNRDEIIALQLIFGRPVQRRQLTYRQVKDLAARLAETSPRWTTESLWRAYAQLERDKVRGAGAKRALTDVISLVRHAVQLDDELVPYPELVRARYEDWLASQEQAGRKFTPEQRWWLDKIAEQVGVNVSVTENDLSAAEFFDRGGLFRARSLFGADLPILLEELNGALVG